MSSPPLDPELEGYEGPLPLFPLPDVVLLPHVVLPLHIFEPRYVKMVRDAVEDRGLIGMVRLEGGRGSDRVGDPGVRRVGCAGRIHDLEELPDGRFDLKLVGLAAFEIRAETRVRPYRAARVRILPEIEDGSGDEGRILRRILLHLRSAAEGRGEAPPDCEAHLEGLRLPVRVNQLSVRSRCTPDELQALLECRGTRARARRLEQLLRDRLQARDWGDCWRELAPPETTRN